MIRLIAACMLLTCALTVRADPPRVDHHAGEPAPTLTVALANLQDYNARLAAILAQDELTAADLAVVHELTYTLENALARIREDVALVAEHLEAVHLASERADVATVRDRGRSYLDGVRPLSHDR
ncbi:MAG: hypothetical protein RIB46_09785 [Pseudomonadales bacterium]